MITFETRSGPKRTRSTTSRATGTRSPAASQPVNRAGSPRYPRAQPKTPPAVAHCAQMGAPAADLFAVDPVPEPQPNVVCGVPERRLERHLWVPKIYASWADALGIAVGSVKRLGAGRAGLGPAGGGMIFGLWA
jgi:hypothetical protein